MKIIGLIVLACITGLFGAYTVNFQRSILSVRKKLTSDSILIPNGKTARNLVLPLLISIIFIYGLIFFRWYLALAFTIVTFFVIIPIFKILMPKPESNFYLRRIRRNMERKQKTYRSHNDALRELVITDLITRFDSLFVELKGGEPV